MTHFLTLIGDWLILPGLLLLDALLPILAAKGRGLQMENGNPFLMGLRLASIGWLVSLVVGGLNLSHIPLLIIIGMLMHMVYELWADRVSGWWRGLSVGLAGLILMLTGAASELNFEAFSSAMAGMAAAVLVGPSLRSGALSVLARWRNRSMPDWLRKALLITLLRWMDENGLEIPKWLAWRRVTVTQGVMSVMGGVGLRRMRLVALPVNIGVVSEFLDLAQNSLSSLDGLTGPVGKLDVSENPIDRVDAGVARMQVALFYCPNLIRIDNDSLLVVGVDRNRMRDRLAKTEKRILQDETGPGRASARRLM